MDPEIHIENTYKAFKKYRRPHRIIQNPCETCINLDDQEVLKNTQLRELSVYILGAWCSACNVILTEDQKYFTPRILELIYQSTLFKKGYPSDDTFDEKIHEMLSKMIKNDFFSTKELELINQFFESYLTYLLNNIEDDDYFWLANELINVTEIDFDIISFLKKNSSQIKYEKLFENIQNELNKRNKNYESNWPVEKNDKILLKIMDLIE